MADFINGQGAVFVLISIKTDVIDFKGKKEMSKNVQIIFSVKLLPFLVYIRVILMLSLG